MANWTYNQIMYRLAQAATLYDSIMAYCTMVGYQPEEFQLFTWIGIMTNMFYLLVWGRRTGKTMLMVHVSVWCGLIGMKTAWRSALGDQLTRVLDLLNESIFVTNGKAGGGKGPTMNSKGVYDVYILGVLRINVSMMTTAHTRSDEFDLGVVDEAAYVQDESQFPAFNGALASSQFPHMVLISTPAPGTYFEEQHDILLEHGCVSHATYEDLPEHLINYTYINMQRTLLSDFMFRQEFLAEFVTAFGAVFKNIVIEDSRNWPSETRVTHVGMDFHGAIGTMVVEVYVNPSRPREVYVMGEYNEKIPVGMGLNMDWMDIYDNDVYIGAESGGANTGFVIEAQAHDAEKVSSDAEKKSKAIMWIHKCTIHMDKARTPRTLKDIQKAEWDNNKKIKKTQAKNGKYPNHWLDAFINAINEDACTNWDFAMSIG